MHSTGESRLECLFRNQDIGEEKAGKRFAWGTGTILTPSLSTSGTQSSAGEVAAAPMGTISICSALTAAWRMLEGGPELPGHPNRSPPMPRGGNSAHPRHSSC